MPRMGAPAGGERYKSKEARTAESRIRFEQDVYRRLRELETKMDKMQAEAA